MSPTSADDSVASLFERYRAPMRRYLYRMTRNEADAEDLVQETFLRVRRAFPGFRGEAQPSTWIYRIATNVCLDLLRRRAAGPGSTRQVMDALEPGDNGTIGVDLAEAPSLSPEALFETSEMGECVRAYVDALPDTFRAALVLHDLEGFSNPEVAGILGWSVEKAKINVHRARQRLKDVFEKECSFYRDGRGTLHWYCRKDDPPTEGDGGCS